ncbi:MJ0042-type zinc finger domain-containing protein [Rickettsia endosymbiont of Halotydeus destructor]|uniref:MJ0042-type zinc finger domain-containing protein n=1 Tax=Rickettsia endosymbiont of Halotydeus destructor TaxID=2996754 RepID=UPI003BAFE369
MYINCPGCHTKFIVLNEQIGINGRKVKCSKCREVWYQKLDCKITKLTDFGKIEENFESIKNEVYINPGSLPVLLPSKPPSYSFFPLLWISFIIFSLIILLEDNCRFLFKYNELKIENILIRDIKDTNKIKVSCKIVNPLNYQISIPLIRVRIIDKDRKVLASYVVDKMNINISAKQKLNIEMEVDNMPYSAKYLDITLGNKLDFLLK